MSHPRPPEIDVFNALLGQILMLKGDGRPAIGMLAAELSNITGVDAAESAVALFQLARTINGFIDESVVGSRNTRAGERLKARILDLLAPEMLSKQYADYQNVQHQNAQAILDLMSFLDHLEFDSEKFSLSKVEIEDELAKVESEAAASANLSNSQQKLVLAQVALIRRALARFSVDGLGPFRDSIFTSIGRLTIELKSADGDQAAAVRGVIDDLLRVKDIAEIAGGALKLTGPFIAGLLTGPSLG